VAPPSQTIALSTVTGAPLSYTISPPSVPWLSVTGSNGKLTGLTDQTSFTVSIVPSGVPAAQTDPYDATINISAVDPNTQAVVTQLSVDVKLLVSPNPELIANPLGPLVFSTCPSCVPAGSATTCGSAASCLVSLSSTQPVTAELNITSFTETVDNKAYGNWLGGTAPLNTTPANFTVIATEQTTNMPAGGYTGSISIGAAGVKPVLNSPVTIPVKFFVNDAKAILNTGTNDGTLSFKQVAGQNAPPAQTITISTDGQPHPFTAVANSGALNWLKVTNGNG